MKSNGFKTCILICLLLPFLFLESKGQAAIFDGLSVKVSPGALSYNGDMSTNDLNLFKRIAVGSKFGIGTSVIKQFNPFFGIQAQFMAGSLYTSATDNTYFAAALSEFSISARFDPIHLIKDQSFNLSPYLSVGVGTFGFRSVRREINTNVVLLPNYGFEDDGITKAKRQTAMSMPIALGLSYKILPNLQVELEHAVRMTNTDLLDCFKGLRTANDLYSLTSIGFRYTITDNKRSSNASRRTSQIKTIEPIKTQTPELNVFVDCVIPETVKVGETFDVKVRINKGNYRGAAKLVQKYPDGFIALDAPGKGFTYSFINQNVIIEWSQMPADSSLICTYQVKVGESLAGSQTISGRLEYQQPEGAKSVRFNKTIFVEGEKDLTNDTPVIVTKGNIKKSQPLEGIEFRIQCGAFRDNSAADKQLAVKYGISEVIQEEFIDGWYKYTVGSFRTYEEASKYKDSFIKRTKLTTAFLVAYKNGKRLAKISEALNK